MIGAIRQFFSDLAGSEGRPKAVGDEDLRLAVAGLLFHVVAIDGIVSQRLLA